MSLTPAHEQTVTIRFIERWVAHEPRADNPHHKFFVEAKARMKRQGLLVCNVVSDYHYGQIELHHAAVEEAHIPQIDVAKFNEVWGMHLDDEQFQEFVEGKPFEDAAGNVQCALEPLCMLHHRGQEGIHSLGEPEWNVLRTSTDPKAVVSVISNSEIGVVGPPS